MPGQPVKVLSRDDAIVTGHHHFQSASVWIRHPHGVREWLLHLTFGGAAMFRFEGGSLEVKAGDILLTRPGVPLDYGIPARPGHWNVTWAIFEDHPAWTPWLRWPEAGPGHLHLNLQDRLIRRKVTDALRQMHQLASGVLPQRQLLALNALESALLWCLSACPQASAAPDDRVHRAMDFLARNLAHKVSLRQTAAHVGVSVPHLTRLFRRHANCSMGQYLESLRLNRARQLLDHTALSICAIAWEVGFDNPFYFSASFRRMTGLSPRAYRKRQRPT